ncbi:MAG: ATP-binding protein [Gammaproteobacteria bacterium]|nr:ATP-binding protein [Gammaproteobacteria bacterium]
MKVDFLREIYLGLLDTVVINKHRYLFDQVDLNNQLIGIVGARGVGKTTLMLQLIKQKLPSTSKAFYVSADNIYFQENLLFEFVAHLHRYENIDHFFIDEIHRYPNWDQELKNIYDSFPKIKIVFSGSSSIDLVKGSYDLSRRAKLHTLYGLSFREYLNFYQGLTQPTISFDNLINHSDEIASTLSKLPMLLGHFQDYLAHGYYPYYQEDPQGFYDKIHQTIDKAIYQDIANFYQLKTQNLVYFKRILNFLATIPPGEFSINKLAKNLQIDNKTVHFYLEILTEIMLVRVVTVEEGGNTLLRLPIKVFIDNTTLLTALNSYLGESLAIGTIRELFFLQSTANASLSVFYSNIGDYTIKNHYFEIGGKHKTARQLKSKQHAFVVKDGILHPSHNILPLYLFGFLY